VDAGVADAALEGAPCAPAVGAAGVTAVAALVVDGSKPGSDDGRGFIGSAAGEKPGTVEPPLAVALGALDAAAVGADGAFSAGEGAEPAGTLPGSSPPTLAPGTINRSLGAGCGLPLLVDVAALGFAGASSA
jgi:hypothetical protein